jgi:hypothetical protein
MTVVLTVRTCEVQAKKESSVKEQVHMKKDKTETPHMQEPYVREEP